MTKITRIFLDLDGVLADWASAAILLHDHDPAAIIGSWPPGVYELAEVLGISGNEMWRPINSAGAAFWANLAQLPWCIDLMTACTGIAPTTILTSPSKDPSAAAGKTQWMQSVFGSSFRDYLVGPAKAACAYPGAVLVDDRDENCRSFVATPQGVRTGGAAIVFPQPWNSAHVVMPWTDRAGPVSYVQAKLHACIEHAG
jgi:hypothetical protein